MSRREDTVVSRLPNRFIRAATQVSQVKHISELDGYDEPTNAYAAGQGPHQPTIKPVLDALTGVPPLPDSWGRATAPAPGLRSAAPRPAVVSAGHPTARPAAPHAPSPRLGSEPALVRRAHVAPAPAPVPRPQLASSAAPSVDRQTVGKVLVMFSCRGGAGSTTLTVNTAAQLVRAGKSVCVLDLDLQLGDVFVALNLKPDTSIAALAREASTIDKSAMLRRLVRHDSGIYAITQTGRIDDIDPELVERMPALLSALTDHFDYVIVDGIRDFGDYALSVLDMADKVAMIVTQDVPAIRRAARVISLFRQLGYSDQKLQLVLNRWARRAPVSEDEIQRALGLRLAAVVRNDYRRARGALDQGALIGDLSRTAGISKDLVALTEMLSSASVRPATPTAKPRRSILSILRREPPTPIARPVLVDQGGN